MPVIQPSPTDGLFRNVKAKGADQMESCSGGGAGAGNVAAVLGNLRLHQYDIQQKPHLGRTELGQTISIRSQPIVRQMYRKINRENSIFSSFYSIHINLGAID